MSNPFSLEPRRGVDNSSDREEEDMETVKPDVSEEPRDAEVKLPSGELSLYASERSAAVASSTSALGGFGIAAPSLHSKMDGAGTKFSPLPHTTQVDEAPEEGETVHFHMPAMFAPARRVRHPKNLPRTYMRNRTSFDTLLSGEEIYDKIFGLLSNAGNDVKVHLQPPQADKLKLKGQGFSRTERTVFTIKFFQDGQKVVVVCNWQSGCVLLFNRLYYRLLDFLGDAVIRSADSTAPSVPPDFLSRAPPSTPGLNPAALSMIALLLTRALSEVIDEKLGAMDVLLQFTQGESGRAIFEAGSTADLLNVVQSLLRCDEIEVVRVGANFLKNLLRLGSADFNQQVPLELVARMFELLRVPTTYMNSDGKQQLVAGLKCLSDTRPEAFTEAQLSLLQQESG